MLSQLVFSHCGLGVDLKSHTHILHFLFFSSTQNQNQTWSFRAVGAPQFNSLIKLMNCLVSLFLTQTYVPYVLFIFLTAGTGPNYVVEPDEMLSHTYQTWSTNFSQCAHIVSLQNNRSQGWCCATSQRRIWIRLELGEYGWDRTEGAFYRLD